MLEGAGRKSRSKKIREIRKLIYYLILFLALFSGTIAGARGDHHIEADHRYEHIDRGVDPFWQPVKRQEDDVDSQMDERDDHDRKVDDDREADGRLDRAYGNENLLGSQFDRSPFTDLDFRKETFKDLPGSPHVGATEPDFDLHISESVSDDRGRHQKHAPLVSDKRDQHQHPEGKQFYDEWKKLGTPDYRFRESVPDKIDPTSSGGFGTSPDNGAPVPYNLNGHVDIERGRPWEKKD